MNALLKSLMRSRPAADDPGAPVVRQLFAFLLIGGGAALGFIGVSTAAVSAFASVPAWLVSSLCYAGFILPVYLLHRRFSFQSTAGHARALPRYVAVQLCSLGLATLFSFVAYGMIGLPTLVAAIMVTVLTSGLSFLVLRRWAFAKGP